MNENAKKWVAALRSGEYEQCYTRLHRVGRGYCCLGVGCEVYRAEHADFVYEEGSCGAFYGLEGREGSLPDVVRDWLGLCDNMGRYGPYAVKAALFRHNDCDGKTFDEIADIIESEPEGLFVAG